MVGGGGRRAAVISVVSFLVGTVTNSMIKEYSSATTNVPVSDVVKTTTNNNNNNATAHTMNALDITSATVIPPLANKNHKPDRALVLRTKAPIHPLVLERAYEITKQAEHSNYDFWILLDETNDQQSAALLDVYFRKRGSHLSPPPIFPVSETILLQHYPNITSYIYNTPEPNFDNEPGLCCGLPIMWQMFVPTFAIFMQNTNYTFAWTFEDDVDVYGQHNIVELAQILDEELGDNVDLAASEFHFLVWGKKKRTMQMSAIVDEMEKLKHPWRRFSDGLQRHSFPLSTSVYQEVGRNVMCFGEGVVYPIVWKHNHTFRDFKSLPSVKNETTVFGWKGLTGAGTKVGKTEAIFKTMQHKHRNGGKNHTNATPSTLIFHHELPKFKYSCVPPNC